MNRGAIVVVELVVPVVPVAETHCSDVGDTGICVLTDQLVAASSQMFCVVFVKVTVKAVLPSCVPLTVTDDVGVEVVSEVE